MLYAKTSISASESRNAETRRVNIRGDGLVQFIRTKLSAFESMTWAEIYRGAGGRSGGNNSHPVKVGSLSRQAQDRLA